MSTAYQYIFYTIIISPGQVQHSLQDVGAIFGTGFAEQSAVCLLNIKCINPQ